MPFAVIYDLEDGVAPNAKETAPELAAALLATKAPGPIAVARINVVDLPAARRAHAILERSKEVT